MRKNVDVIGDKPMKKATGVMTKGEEAKQKAWAEPYMLSLSGTLVITCPMNHSKKAHLSQSLLTW